MAAKLLGGEQFKLEDFLDQLIAVRRMGPIANVLSMMPGMGQMKDQIADLDDKHFDRVTAIIRSMTPGERTNPKIINGSRRARIANGSGVTVMDVNQLLNRFAEEQAQGHQGRRSPASRRRRGDARRLPGWHAAAPAGDGPERSRWRPG